MHITNLCLVNLKNSVLIDNQFVIFALQLHERVSYINGNSGEFYNPKYMATIVTAFYC